YVVGDDGIEARLEGNLLAGHLDVFSFAGQLLDPLQEALGSRSARGPRITDRNPGERIRLDQAPRHRSEAGEGNDAQTERATADLEYILAGDQIGNLLRSEPAPELRLVGAGSYEFMKFHFLPE